MEKLLSKQFILQNIGTFGAIVVIFTYSILLDRDLDCTCKQQDSQCFVYLLVPGCLIWVLMLWTRKTFLIICRKCYCCKLCGFWFYDILKSLLIGALWIAFLLLDGDWYVCCLNDHSEQQAQLACKTQANLTYEDRIIIAELKSKSRIIGFSLLAGIIALAVLMSWFEWSRLCQRKPPKCCKRESSRCCNTNGSRCCSRGSTRHEINEICRKPKCCKKNNSQCCLTSICCNKEGSNCCNTDNSRCCNKEGSKCCKREGSRSIKKLICCNREGTNCCNKNNSPGSKIEESHCCNIEESRCCNKEESRCCISSSNKNIYYKMILKEEQNVLKELLRESSKRQLTEGIKGKICGEQWTECFDVAENLINEGTKPRLDEGGNGGGGGGVDGGGGGGEGGGNGGGGGDGGRGGGGDVDGGGDGGGNGGGGDGGGNGGGGGDVDGGGDGGDRGGGGDGGREG